MCRWLPWLPVSSHSCLYSAVISRSDARKVEWKVCGGIKGAHIINEHVGSAPRTRFHNETRKWSSSTDQFSNCIHVLCCFTITVLGQSTSWECCVLVWESQGSWCLTSNRNPGFIFLSSVVCVRDCFIILLNSAWKQSAAGLEAIFMTSSSGSDALEIFSYFFICSGPLIILHCVKITGCGCSRCGRYNNW